MHNWTSRDLEPNERRKAAILKTNYLIIKRSQARLIESAMVKSI